MPLNPIIQSLGEDKGLLATALSAMNGQNNAVEIAGKYITGRSNKS